MTPGAERVRRHRERRQLERARIAAELARSLPAKVLAAELAKLGTTELEELKWRLAEAAAVSGRCNARQPHDAYFTQPEVAAAITARVAELVPRPLRILEPSAGLGAFVQAARATWSGAAVIAVDVVIRPELHALRRVVAVCKRDFLSFSCASQDLIIGNPPFNNAEAHVEHALKLLKHGGHLALLLRQGFAGSLKRALGLWSSSGLRYTSVITPRPSFVGRGTDKAEYSLFIWQRGYSGKAESGKPIIWRGADELQDERGAA